jgi:hypothetical protein
LWSPFNFDIEAEFRHVNPEFFAAAQAEIAGKFEFPREVQA